MADAPSRLPPSGPAFGGLVRAPSKAVRARDLTAPRTTRMASMDEAARRQGVTATVRK
jgi:hypothetical protein